mmetsp:Transcript_44801/g.108705  ORF Transcript_44801/g.108705 Transcript_44801/m.108705 type:complete len:225 (-) Transcript_44801:1177-1851(-)
MSLPTNGSISKMPGYPSSSIIFLKPEKPKNPMSSLKPSSSRPFVFFNDGGGSRFGSSSRFVATRESNSLRRFKAWILLARWVLRTVVKASSVLMSSTHFLQISFCSRATHPSLEVISNDTSCLCISVHLIGSRFIKKECGSCSVKGPTKTSRTRRLTKSVVAFRATGGSETSVTNRICLLLYDITLHQYNKLVNAVGSAWASTETTMTSGRPYLCKTRRHASSE